MNQYLHSPSEIVKPTREAILASLRDRRFAAQCRLRDAICLRDVIQQETDYRWGEAHLASVDARSAIAYCKLMLLANAGRIRPDNCARYVHAITYPDTPMIEQIKKLFYKHGIISRAAFDAAFDRYEDRGTYGFWFQPALGGPMVYHRKDRLDREWRERVHQIETTALHRKLRDQMKAATRPAPMLKGH